MSLLELAANTVTTLSIVLAARNSIHTWWTGMLGCLLFAAVFYQVQLYADVSLQLFFLLSSAWGWWHWRGGKGVATPRPIARSSPRLLVVLGLGAALLTAAYGSLLHFRTQAYLPFVDSAVMSLSIVAQGLLMARRLETWAFWLLVNSLSVPLFWTRDLHLTALLYSAYWFNACWGAWRWWRELRQAQTTGQVA